MLKQIGTGYVTKHTKVYYGLSTKPMVVENILVQFCKLFLPQNHTIKLNLSHLKLVQD